MMLRGKSVSSSRSPNRPVLEPTLAFVSDGRTPWHHPCHSLPIQVRRQALIVISHSERCEGLASCLLILDLRKERGNLHPL